MAGNGLILANAGANQCDGNEDFDYLSYAEHTGAGTTATQGATINYATMIVSNPWGKLDVLTGVEEIKGSTIDDTYLFVGGPNQFQIGEGLAGSGRFINQAGSNTWLICREDAMSGGTGGITVRLGSVASVAGNVKGRIVNGFGVVDKVTEVNKVEGTAQDDRFFGSILNDHFNGLSGADSFSGGGAVPTASTWTTSAARPNFPP